MTSIFGRREYYYCSRSFMSCKCCTSLVSLMVFNNIYPCILYLISDFIINHNGLLFY
uniref:Uncharacterized protein n=1 Tax=Aegilops tauschii subsp. strangulata TaxID=200361 RepID=A0A452ZK26_AEGTS